MGGHASHHWRSRQYFHTTNGGKTWKQQGGLFSQLSGISFADALHGVAVGNEYRFTVDGGKTWQPSNPVGGSYYDVDLVDQNTGYACGFGEVRKTTDGGLNWVSQPISLFGNFVGIDFVSATTGWVVGDDVPGSIWKRSGSASAAIEKTQPRGAPDRSSSPASGKLRHPDLQLKPTPRDSRLTNKRRIPLASNATTWLVSSKRIDSESFQLARVSPKWRAQEMGQVSQMLVSNANNNPIT